MDHADGIKVISSGKVYEILFAIERNYRFWISSESIVALENFMAGYMTLAGYSDEIYYPGEPPYNEFIYWMINKSKKDYNLSFPLTKILLKRADHKEEKAFALYFEELRKFMKEWKETNNNN